MTDRLKTVYPPKTSFCGGYKNTKNRYTLHTQFYYVQVGFKGVFVAQTCFPDVSS